MRFVVCGECLIDLIPGEVVSTAESHWAAMVGGGPMNSSVALARLGADVQYLGRLGSDAFGKQIEGHLRANGVGLDLAVHSDDATPLAVVSLDDDGKAEYNFHFADTASFSWRAGEFPELTENDWLHFGSIGFVVGTGVEPLLEFIRTTPASLSFDLNIRPTVIPDRQRYLDMITPLMQAVGASGGIVKASDDDINWLVDGHEPLAHAQRWIEEYGLGMFLVTLGSDGSVALRPGERGIVVPAQRIELLDTVGAGDTFMAGFLNQYINDRGDIELALRHGAAASAIVCTRKGANPPTLDEVHAFMAR